MSRATLRIATRASRLALWQAQFVADRLHAIDLDLDVQLVHVTTTGDQAASAPLSGLGGVGVFTREIQQAVLDDRADVAVHSLKDLPTVPVAGIQLAGVPLRASPWDALVMPSGSTQPQKELRDLPRAARVGTGSLRRRAQILHVRPDLQFLEVRGNVDTRLRKLDEGSYDALILAEAGLDRLGLADRVSARLMPPDVFPAVGQGALGLECRSDDQRTADLLAQLTDIPTFAAVTAERQVLNRLRAGCHAPVGVAVMIDADAMSLEAVVLSRDGRQRLYARHSGQLAEPLALGERVADDLLRQGAAPLIEEAAVS
ncbi:MAG TPA: hydroxymethylbilane synthase [Planctomycetaceae bacterium]|nr:hydroxymethylbilane synthase [Planctomycetaceae bacterium]